MTDPAELAKGLDLSTDNLKLHLGELTTAEVLTARAAIRWALDQLASTMSAEEVREAAAKLSESHATCGCGGKQGWCNEDGWPLAIAAAIRAMPLTK